MGRKITRGAPGLAWDTLTAWLDRETGRLFRQRLARLGVGRQEAADLLGISRMTLHRIMAAGSSRLDVGRKLEVYVRLLEWAMAADADEAAADGARMVWDQAVGVGASLVIGDYQTGSRRA